MIKAYSIAEIQNRGEQKETRIANVLQGREFNVVQKGTGAMIKDNINGDVKNGIREYGKRIGFDVYFKTYFGAYDL